MEIISLQNLTPETIIFGGLTLVSLALVTLVWRISVRYGNHTNDVIDKNTEAWIKQAHSHEKNASALTRLADVVEEKFK